MSASINTSAQSEGSRSFEDLEVYKAARDFRKAMYQVAKNLPDFEKFGLVSQIRRASVSLTNNLAEGHGRFHFLDQIKFTLISRGSLEELIDDLNICLDENYIQAAQLEKLKSSVPYKNSAEEESMEWLEQLLEKYPEIAPWSATQLI